MSSCLFLSCILPSPHITSFAKRSGIFSLSALSHQPCVLCLTTAILSLTRNGAIPFTSSHWSPGLSSSTLSQGSFLECRSEHVPLMLETCPQSWLVSEHFQQTISVLIMGLPSILQNLCHILPISQRRRLRIRVSQRGSLPSRQGGRSSLEPLSLFIRPSLPRCLKGPPGLPALACPPAAAFHTPLPRALWPEVLPDT